MSVVLIAALFVVLVFFILAQVRVVGILLISVAQRRRPRPPDPACPALAESACWRSVTVQLPVYREHRVLRRLLSAVSELEYPRGRLAIQVLDDSEEHPAGLARAIVEEFCQGPVPVEYIHRSQRAGYKSGALNNGNRQANGDLIAVFDADFLPCPEFLLRTVPFFQDERVGGVHTRWRHRNELDSPLTMLQAAVLDSLFCFESALRQRMGESSLYLGTSGVWRRRVIDELGGWREAPFTDDGIDLSCRADMAGWRVAFLDEPLSSSDLPDTYLAYKNQQRRWARAALRVFLDYWRYAFARRRGLGVRFLELSLLHLVMSTPSLLLVVLASSLYVALGLPRTTPWLVAELGLTAALVLFPPAQEAILSQRLLYADWRRRARLLLRSLPLAIGVSISVLAGFWDTFAHGEGEFVTTPKLGAQPVMQSSTLRWVRTASRIALVELATGLLALAALVAAIERGYLESLALLAALSGAYLISGWTSWREVWARRGTG